MPHQTASPWKWLVTVWLGLSICLHAETASRIQQLQQAAASIQRGDLSAAELPLQLLLKQDSADALALNLLGVVRVEQNQPAEAEKLFHRAIATGHPIAGPHINLAKLYAADRPLDALAELEKALALAPTDPSVKPLLREVARNAALAVAKSGDNAKALEILTRAAASLPHDPQLLCDQGTVTLKLGNFELAQQYFQQALEADPAFADARVGLAHAYLQLSRAQDAEAQMRLYLKDRPDDAAAHYGLGYILMAEQKIEGAQTEFEASVRLQPRQSESPYQLGEIALQKGSNSLAFQQFTNALAANPRHGGALTGLAVLAFRDARYDEARRLSERAIAAAPDYQKAHYYLALTLAKLGLKADADREFESARKLQKHHKALPNLSDTTP